MDKLANAAGTTLRMTAKGALLDRARRLHEQAQGLEALAAAMPDLPQQADDALWSLAIRAS